MVEQKDILGFFAKISLSDAVKNIQILDDEVRVGIISPYAAMHQKQKWQKEISAQFDAFFSKKLHLSLQILSSRVTAKVDPNETVVKDSSSKERAKLSSKGQPIEGVSHIIAIASAKGGVGKSTVAANLAVSLVEQGFRVGLLDADIYGPSASVLFALEGQTPKTIAKGGKNYMQPIEKYGVKVMSIAFFAATSRAVVWRGPMASKALHQMLRDTLWGELDYLLVDLPPGTGDIHLSMIQNAPITGAVIVSTPSGLAIADVRRGIAMFGMDKIDIPVLGLVQNMAYFTPKETPKKKYYLFGKSSAQELANQNKIPFLGDIPIVEPSLDEGTSDVGGFQQKELRLVYQQIAQRLRGNLDIRKRTKEESKAVEITTTKGCDAKNKKV